MARYHSIDASSFSGAGSWILRGSATFSFDQEPGSITNHGASGTMIAPGLILTDAHVVFHLTPDGKREWATGISYYRGPDETPSSSTLVASSGALGLDSVSLPRIANPDPNSSAIYTAGEDIALQKVDTQTSVEGASLPPLLVLLNPSASGSPQFGAQHIAIAGYPYIAQVSSGNSKTWKVAADPKDPSEVGYVSETEATKTGTVDGSEQKFAALFPSAITFRSSDKSWEATNSYGGEGNSGGPLLLDYKDPKTGEMVWCVAGVMNNANYSGIPIPTVTGALLGMDVIAAADKLTPGTSQGWKDLSKLYIVGSSASEKNTKGSKRSDLFELGGGDDSVIASVGDDFVDGGEGSDTVDYRGMSFKLVGGTSSDGAGVHIAKGADGLYGTDTLHDVEKVVIGKQTLNLDTVAQYDPEAVSERMVFSFQTGIAVDQLVASESESDATPLATLDLSTFGSTTGITFDNGRLGGTNWSFSGADAIIGSAHDDTIVNIESGTAVTTGAGADRVGLSNNVLVTDASSIDRLVAYGNMVLTGGVSWKGSEDVWAYGAGHLTKYAYNIQGELGVADNLGNIMYVADGQSTNNNPDSTTRAFGLLVAEISITAKRFLDLERPWDVIASYATILGTYSKAMLGISHWWGVDPLVLDLDGNGISLTGQSSISPRFDLDGDGFSEKAGWIGSGDGFLALDANGNGVIDDVSELFGGPRADGGVDTNGDGKISRDERVQSGFAELATFDQNHDGVIDASDAVFSQLRVWVDADGDAVTDAGELKTLTEAGVASISLDSTAQSGTFQAGNQITETGTFTRTDGSTATLANVDLKVDNFDSLWLSAGTVSARAAALPELRGHGTLADLRQVMTLAPTLETPVAAALTGLAAARDLDQLRTAARPVLYAWAAAMPTTVPTEAYSSVKIVYGTDTTRRTVVDYAWKTTDATGEHWYLASVGAANRSWGSFEELQAAKSQYDGRWGELTSADLAFVERYTGDMLPTVLDAGTSTAAVVAALDMASTYIDMLSLRLAVQASPEYYGLTYDSAADVFRPAAVDRQLVPFFEHVFGELQGASAATVAARLSDADAIFNRIITSYDRGTGNSVNSYGFIYANIVAAYENVGLPISLTQAAIDFGIPADHIVARGGATVEGTGGEDLFYLGAGDETVSGHGGHDNYIVGKNFGHDVIVDDESSTAHEDNYLRFAQTASTDVTASRDGLDLVLTVTATGDTLRVSNQFHGYLPGVMGGGETSSAWGVDLIQFSDGIQWTRDDIPWKVSLVSDASETLTGTPDKDVLDGGAGDDTLIGGNDFDIYLFGRGYGHDTVDEAVSRIGSGAFAAAGLDQDAIVFGAGITEDDLIFSRDGRSSDLVLSIAGSSDTLTIRDQFGSTYTGVFGHIWMDRIEVFQFTGAGQMSWDEVLTRTIDAHETSGNDTVYGFDAEDVLDGGAGDDFLSGGNENDTYVFGLGYGHDTIQDALTNIESGTVDTVRFGLGIGSADIALSHPEGTNDLVVTLADGSTLTIRNQFGVTYTGVFGEVAFDRIERFVFTGADGTETVLSNEDMARRLLAEAKTEGDDRIFGFASNDRLDGGAGNDLLAGGNGADTYVFGRGWGHDSIDENSTNILSEDGDVVEMAAGVAASDVVVSRSDGNDLVLTISDTGDSLTLIGEVSYGVLNWRPKEVETVRFADGSTWTADDLRLKALATASTAGNDTIRGYFSDDTIDGGAGDDVMKGGDGSDTYRFGRGSGHDRIEESVDIVVYTSDDRVVFGPGVSPSDLLLTRPGNGTDIVLTIADTGDSLTLARQTEETHRVESFVFADGTVWSAADLFQKVIDVQQTAGDDAIVGFNGDDSLAGGRGNDILQGGDGNDTYVFAAGDGADRIVEGGGTDTLRISGWSSADLTFYRSGDSLVIAAGGGDQISIVQHFDGSGGRAVEKIVFDDGSQLSSDDIAARLSTEPLPLSLGTHVGSQGADVISGTAGADQIIGLAGDDTLLGGQGPDTYVWAKGDGNDTIDDHNVWAATDTDTLALTDVARTDVRFVRDGDTLFVDVLSTGERITVLDHFASSAVGIDVIRFADGSTMSRSEIASQVWIVGTDGSETLSGTPGADILWGRHGDDTLLGGQGPDTYVWAKGDGNDTIDDHNVWAATDTDTLALTDVARTDVRFLRDGNTLFMDIISTGERITVFDHFSSSAVGIDVIRFADGSTMSRSEIASQVWIAGTDGAETLSGTPGADTLWGRHGDDTLLGGQGPDTYVWVKGDGNDTIDDHNVWDAADTDTLALLDVARTDVRFLRNGNTLFVDIISTGERITVTNHFSSSTVGIDVIRFADGSTMARSEIASQVWTAGTDGAETLSGTGGADILWGRHGDDTLLGGQGPDTYVWAKGDGNDIIDDHNVWDVADTDTLALTDVAKSEIRLLRSGNTLFVDIIPTGERITVTNHFASSTVGIDVIRFADGSTMSRQEIADRAMFGGTSAVDTVTGNDGANILWGGAGADTLAGGRGSDTYVWAKGDGNDTIDDQDTQNTADSDALRLDDVDVSGVVLARKGNHLTITIAATGEVISVVNQFAGDRSGIERLVFADGTTWARADVTLHLASIELPSLNGTELADTLTGTSGPDEILGLGGNDSIYGQDGGDILDGGAGNDFLRGGQGDDTYRFGRGYGSDTIDEEGSSAAASADRILFGSGVAVGDVSFSRSGTNLVAKIAGTTDTLTIQDGLWAAINNSGNTIDQVEYFDFADGTRIDIATIRTGLLTGGSGNDDIVGYGSNDILEGGVGNDWLSGRQGDDTYLFSRGYGNDTIDEEGSSAAASADRILFGSGVAVSDVSFSRSGTNLVAKIAGTTDTLTIQDGLWAAINNSGNTIDQVEYFDFADGTRIDIATIRTGLLTGGTGNDNIAGYGSNDVLDGGIGNDWLSGRQGDDTYLFGRGYGNDTIDEEGSSAAASADRILFGSGVAVSDVSFSRSGTNLVAKIAGTTDTLTIQDGLWAAINNSANTIDQVEYFDFADGTRIDIATIRTGLLTGGSGNDDIAGYGSNDTLYGGTGNDRLTGGAGSDTYRYFSGDGSDTIDDADGTGDRLVFADLNAADVQLLINGSDLKIGVLETGATITDLGHFSNATRGLDQIAFADGTNWSRTEIAQHAAA